MDTFEDLVDFAETHGFSDQATTNTLRTWLQAFANVKEPEVDYHVKYITMDARGVGGVSTKPGNIVLNWRKLFDVGPDAAIAASAYATSTPFLRALICLYVWNKVWRGSEQELSDVEASIIETLWLRYGRDKGATGDAAFDAVNEARLATGLAVLSRSDFEQALDRLVSMRCVKLRDGNIRLIEWIRKRT